MRSTHRDVWHAHWRDTLKGCRKRLFLFDLDGTVWDDLLVILNQEFGPVEPDGTKRWLKYDAAFKKHGTMSNGAHLEAEYRDLLEAKPLAELITWLRANHKLVPGITPFLQFLMDENISPVAVSNGAVQIADAMLLHHNIVMPRVCNSLRLEGDRFTGLDFFHDEVDGINKGELVKAAVELGHEVIGCAGDSKGDISLARETASAGGLVVAVDEGLIDWCRENDPTFSGNGQWWLDIHRDYDGLSRVFQQRIAGY